MRPSLDVHARALARAFHEDPATRYLLPNPARRGALTRCALRLAVISATANAQVWSTAHRWARLSAQRLVRSGFAAAPFVVGVPALRRMARFGHAIDELHQQLITEPHWYLFILGATPASAGAGSRLLAPGLGRADRDGLPCYLETSAPARFPSTCGTVSRS